MVLVLPNQIEKNSLTGHQKQPALTLQRLLAANTQKRSHYPDKVFREMPPFVNACVHRNYSITGSRIRSF